VSEYDLWSEAITVCNALKSQDQIEMEWARLLSEQEPIVLNEPHRG